MELLEDLLDCLVSGDMVLGEPKIIQAKVPIIKARLDIGESLLRPPGHHSVHQLEGLCNIHHGQAELDELALHLLLLGFASKYKCPNLAALTGAASAL